MVAIRKKPEKLSKKTNVVPTTGKIGRKPKTFPKKTSWTVQKSLISLNSSIAENVTSELKKSKKKTSKEVAKTSVFCVDKSPTNFNSNLAKNVISNLKKDNNKTPKLLSKKSSLNAEKSPSICANSSIIENVASEVKNSKKKTSKVDPKISILDVEKSPINFNRSPVKNVFSELKKDANKTPKLLANKSSLNPEKSSSICANGSLIANVASELKKVEKSKNSSMAVKNPKIEAQNTKERSGKTPLKKTQHSQIISPLSQNNVSDADTKQVSGIIEKKEKPNRKRKSDSLSEEQISNILQSSTDIKKNISLPSSDIEKTSNQEKTENKVGEMLVKDTTASQAVEDHKVDQPIDEEQIRKAVIALKKIIPENKTELFPAPKSIEMQFSYIRIPNTPPRVLRFSLPHPLVSEESSICLFATDSKNDDHQDIESTIEIINNILHENEITCITEVIPLKQLKTEYRGYEFRRTLSNNFDVFLSDARISGHVLHLLGKEFMRKRQYPVPVKLNAKDLKAEVNRALSKTAFQLTSNGNCCNIKIGHSDQSVEQITDNIIAVIKGLMTQLPGGWNNIRSAFIKVHKILPIPIYVTMKPANTVSVPIQKSPWEEKAEPITGELTTLLGAEVTVYPSGHVVVQKKLEDSDDEYDDLWNEFRDDDDDDEDDDEDDDDNAYKKKKFIKKNSAITKHTDIGISDNENEEEEDVISREEAAYLNDIAHTIDESTEKTLQPNKKRRKKNKENTKSSLKVETVKEDDAKGESTEEGLQPNKKRRKKNKKNTKPSLKVETVKEDDAKHESTVERLQPNKKRRKNNKENTKPSLKVETVKEDDAKNVDRESTKITGSKKHKGAVVKNIKKSISLSKQQTDENFSKKVEIPQKKMKKEKGQKQKKIVNATLGKRLQDKKNPERYFK